jgi:thioredoxin
MKKVFSILVSLLAISMVVQSQTVQHIDALKFKDLAGKGNTLILDVRTPGEYSRGHIKGSTLIDISNKDFVSRLNLLQKDKTILIYCLTGSRSHAAASFMARNGFKSIYNLQRGIIDWNSQGFPLEQSNQVIASKSTIFSEQSFSKLLADNKLVLVDFHAVWCAPCKAMSPVIDKISADFKGKAKIEKVDVEQNKLIATAYQVQSIPGFVLFKAGKKVWSHTGTISYEDLSGVIKKYL